MPALAAGSAVAVGADDIDLAAVRSRPPNDAGARRRERRTAGPRDAGLRRRCGIRGGGHGWRLRLIDAAQQRAGLVDDPVRIREHVPFLEVARERDFELAKEKCVARRYLPLAHHGRAVQRAAVRAAGVAQIDTAVGHSKARVASRERRRVDDQVARRRAPDQRLALTQWVRPTHAGVDEPQREQAYLLSFRSPRRSTARPVRSSKAATTPLTSSALIRNTTKESPVRSDSQCRSPLKNPSGTSR